MDFPTLLEAVKLAMMLVFGCVVGSFLNVCIWRLPRGATITQPRRSCCPHCGAAVRGRDNIPLFSYLALRGRCRDCGGTISFRYFAVEAITGLFFALIYWRQGVQLGTDVGVLTIMLLVVALLIFASAIDIEFLIIPDEIVAFGCIGGLLAGFLLPQLHVGTSAFHTLESLTGNVRLDGLISSGIGMVGSALGMMVVYVLGAVVFQREALGLGDVKLMAMIGAFFGWKIVFVGFVLAPFIGLLHGLPMALLYDEHIMPYGPWLSLGTALTLIFRDELCGHLVSYGRQIGDIFAMLGGN